MVRILFLAADPLASSKGSLDEEIRAIDAKIRGARHRDLLSMDSHWAVRLEDLSGILLRHSADIVHLSGNGKRTASNDDGERAPSIKPVSPEALASFIQILKDNVRIVVLKGCSSQAQAKSLVKSIDVAIGIEDQIENDRAISFAAEFYQALAFGRSVGDAYKLGLARLTAEGVAQAGQRVKLHKRRGVKPDEIILIEEPTHFPH
jgi:hypothetical protein